MSNRSYNVTGSPGSSLFGSSAVIRSEFLDIQTGFTEIEGEIDAKAAIAGQTYTGTHDFTGGVTKVATPATASDAVTKLYVDGISFSPALPGQTGNAGKVITTDGTTASWAAVTEVLAKTTTGGLSVSELSGRYVITNTGAGGDIALPLPAATPGLSLRKTQVTVAHYLKQVADGTDVFRYGSFSSAAGGYIRSNVVGDSWSLTCSIVGIWDISDIVGSPLLDE